MRVYRVYFLYDLLIFFKTLLPSSKWKTIINRESDVFIFINTN